MRVKYRVKNKKVTWDYPYGYQNHILPVKESHGFVHKIIPTKKMNNTDCHVPLRINLPRILSDQFGVQKTNEKNHEATDLNHPRKYEVTRQVI